MKTKSFDRDRITYSRIFVFSVFALIGGGILFRMQMGMPFFEPWGLRRYLAQCCLGLGLAFMLSKYPLRATACLVLGFSIFYPLAFFYLPVPSPFLFNTITLLLAALAGWSTVKKKRFPVRIGSILLLIMLLINVQFDHSSELQRSWTFPMTRLEGNRSITQAAIKHAGWTGTPENVERKRYAAIPLTPHLSLRETSSSTVSTAICETWGWLGLITAMIVLGLVFASALVIAFECHTSWIRYTTAAFAFYIFFQSIFHLLAALGLYVLSYPNGLPFLGCVNDIDFGGLIPYFALGWVMRIANTSNQSSTFTP